MKKILVLALLIVIPLMAFGQGSWFKRGITVGLTGSKIDTITADSESVTFKTPSYTHQLYPVTIGAGLTKTGTEVTLGETLTDDVTIENAGSLYDFYIETALDATSRSGRIALNNGVLYLTGYDNSAYNSTSTSQLSLVGTTATLSHNGAVSSNYLTVDATGIKATTDITGGGIYGSAYYGAAATANSYVQKQYVDNAVSAGGDSTWSSVTVDTTFLGSSGVAKIWHVGDDIYFSDDATVPIKLETIIGQIAGFDTQISPSAGTDGYSITWDNDISRFILEDVSGGGGGTYTADNGIYLNGSEFELGDTLNRNTTISNGDDYDLLLDAYSVSDAASSRIGQYDDGRTVMASYDNATFNSTANVSWTMWGDYLSLAYNGAVASNSLVFSDTGIYIDAGISGRGLMAAAYYGASNTDNDYVQKKYVDDAINASGGVTSGMRDTINDLYDQVFTDTIDLASLVRMKTDTIPLMPWVKGEGLSGDSASFNVGGSMIIKWESSAGDTLVVDNFCGNVDASAKSVTVKVEIDDTYAFSSPTTIMAATAITGSSAAGTGQYITSFSSHDIPPEYYIKLTITALSTDKPNQFLGQLNGHMKN